MKVSIVIPTIQGREDLFAQTKDGYAASKPATVEFEYITPKDFPTIGEAWNAGAAKATGEFLHLTADDVIPHEGWIDAAINATNRAEWPCPKILNPDGSLHSCGTLGGGMLLPDCPTGTPCAASPFPFFRSNRWVQLGPALGIHYYADDALGWKARSIGLTPTVCAEFTLTHLEGTVGRAQVAARSQSDSFIFRSFHAGGQTCE